VDIFEYLHPEAVGLWVFDCSSSHKGLTSDALNVNNINVHLGGKLTLMCDTIIPLTNPAPENGETDTHGHSQTMVYLHDHPDPNLAGKAKGMAVVVKEWQSVYSQLVKRLGVRRRSLGSVVSAGSQQ
jgi:hypothetical protein